MGWQNFAKFCRKWQNFAKFDRNWQNLAEFGGSMQNLTKFERIRGGMEKEEEKEKAPHKCESIGPTSHPRIAHGQRYPMPYLE